MDLDTLMVMVNSGGTLPDMSKNWISVRFTRNFIITFLKLRTYIVLFDYGGLRKNIDYLSFLVLSSDWGRFWVAVHVSMTRKQKKNN